MARRMVDGSFFTNERVAKMPQLCRLFLLGLIANVADDQGRMSANPALLRATVLPFEDIGLTEIQEFLEILVENNTLVLYEADGKQVAQLVNWWQYQEQMQYAAPSKLLPPDGWKDRIRLTVGRGKAALTYGWHLRDGTIVPDTCDRHGRPLPSSGQGGQSEAAPVQAALGLEVKPTGIASDEAVGKDASVGEGDQSAAQLGEIRSQAAAPGVTVVAGPAPAIIAVEPAQLVEVASATTNGKNQWAIVSDDLPTGPRHLRNQPLPPPPAETQYTAKAVKKNCLRLAVDPRKFVDGKIPRGKGETKFEIFYEFASINAIMISDYNRDRIDEAVQDNAKWRAVLEAWFGVQNKPDNFTGQLQWYSEGIPTYAQAKRPTTDRGNGKANTSGDHGATGPAAGLGQRATIDFATAQQLFGRHRNNPSATPT